MNRTALFLTATLFISALPPSTVAETLTAVVIDELPEGFYPGPFLPSTSIVDIDTDSGKISNPQRFTGTGPGQFSALDRDASGILYAISNDNLLVTVDEESGEATTVATLSLPDQHSFTVEGLAFVPDESGQTLFALVSTVSEVFDGPGPGPGFGPEGEDDEPELPYFFLATVDFSSGTLSDTGFDIGAELPFFREHGIDYHPLLRKIVHGFSGFGSILQLIDPETGEIDQVVHATEGPSPYEFQGIACGSDGSVFVYDDDSEFYFRLDISAAAPEAEHGYDFEFTADILFPAFVFEDRDEEEEGGDIESGPFDEMDPSSPDSLELTADGWLLTEIDGALRRFPSNTDVLEEEEFELPEAIETKVPGQTVTAIALAVNPVTGELFALTSKADNEFDLYLGGSMGINVIDREGGELYDVGDNELDLFADMGSDDPYDVPPLGLIISIAFDRDGNLFGLNPYHGIVSIDSETGEISASHELYISGNESVAFHPTENRFYVLTSEFDSFDEESSFAVVEFFESEDEPGFDANVIELSGDSDFISEYPSASTFWKNRLYFATTDFDEFYDGRGGEDSEISTIYSLSLDGSVLRESSIPLPIVALAPPVIQTVPQVVPDVLVGEPGKALVGDNIYSTNGSGQTIRIESEGKRLSGKFVSLIQNDGDGAGYVTISTVGGNRSDDVRYMLNGANVSAAIRSGLMTHMNPRATHQLEVKYERDKGRRWRTSFRVIARSESAVDVGLVRSDLKEKRKKKRKKAPRDPRHTGL